MGAQPAHGRGPHGRGRNRQRGQTTLEFALVIPLFSVLLFGVLDAGRIVWANSSLAESAREAARFAIVHGGWANTQCPVGPPTPEVAARLPIPPSASCPYPSPSKQAVVDRASALAFAPGSNLVVHVCYGEGCSGDTDAPGASNARGTPVTVALDSDVPLVAGALLGLGAFHIRGSSTMLVNN
jgi:TadE-like protein